MNAIFPCQDSNPGPLVHEIIALLTMFVEVPPGGDVTDLMTATLPNRGAQLKILSDYRYRMKKKMFPQRENIVKNCFPNATTVSYSPIQIVEKATVHRLNASWDRIPA